MRTPACPRRLTATGPMHQMHPVQRVRTVLDGPAKPSQREGQGFESP